MKARNIILMGCMTVMGIAFTSCSKGISFDYEAADNQTRSEYESNFVKKYGEIDPNQTWDFSTMEPMSSLEDEGSASTRAFTRAYNNTQGSMEIEGEVIDWVTANLKAGNNNFLKGSPFSVEVPNNPETNNAFTIVPIYQGQAGYYWQFCMKVGTGSNAKDYILWSKGDIKYKTSENGTWKSPGTGGDGMKDVYAVQAPTFTITGLTAGTKLEFYLRVWDNTTDYTIYKGSLGWLKAPRFMSSLNKQMIALESAKKPAALSSDYDVTIIGCEDKAVTGTGSDRDYEDLVVMMYGNPGPPVNHVNKRKVSTTKRYLIEDLGATNDFDFNDVVVDVSEVVWYQIYYKNNGLFDHETEISRSQEAIIRAMGGTRNFTLKIGDTSWSKSDSEYATTDMLNTGWNNTEINENAELAKFTVTGWDKDANNISINVERQGGSHGYYTITFPKKGAVPMIIATNANPLEKWMKEKQSVPNTWYTE